MSLFLAKLTLTPLIMYLASAAGRRFGPGVSGWLTGLPLLAGPVSVFIWLEQGAAFAADAAAATLTGIWSSCAFCLAYDSVADRGWLAAALAAIAAFALSTVVLSTTSLPALVGFAGVLAGAAVCLRVIRAPAAETQSVRPPPWDMPARLAIAAAFVVLQTGIAGALGPQLSGLVTPFPIVVIVLVVFAHRQWGASGAIRVLRGFLIGMYAFATFFLLVALGIDRVGALAAYLLALLACLAVNGLTLASLRRKL